MNTYDYTYWLANNFNQYINTNPFAPQYQDDMDLIINDYDDYEPLEDEPLYNPYEFDDQHYNDNDDDDDADEFNIINPWLFD